jgi:hypothetical protein
MSYLVQPPGAIARAGALLLIAASAALGTFYAYQLGRHFGAGVALAFAAMALGGEVLKPIAVERAFEASWRRPLRAIACLAVAGVAIAYSLTAELGFSAGARGDLATSRAAEVKSGRDAKAAAGRARDELASLERARSLAELEALVAAARTICTKAPRGGFRERVCEADKCRIVKRPLTWEEVCSKDPDLLAEHGRAKRRAELETAIAAAVELERAAGAVGAADPQAAAVVAYLAAAGWHAEAETVATWLHLLPVLLLEVGSALGLLVAGRVEQRQPLSVGRRQTVAGILAGLRRRVARLATEATVAASPPASATVATVVAPAAPRQPDRQPFPEAQQLLEVLRAAGRPVSNDELAGALGVHKGTASKRVKALGAAVRKDRVGRHVAISLAAESEVPAAPVSLAVERRRRALGSMVRAS